MKQFQAKIPSVMMSSKYEDSKNFEWIFISVAAACAVLVSVAAFIIMKRHTKYKNKFEGLIGSSTEVSKDYQVHFTETDIHTSLIRLL